jgi:hypothetical protein
MKIDSIIEEIFNKNENNTCINTLCLKIDKKFNLSNFDNFNSCKLFLLNSNN